MATCFNKSLPEFKELKRVYKNDATVNLIIEEYQQKNNTDLYPTVVQAAKMLRENRTMVSKQSEEKIEAIMLNLKALGLVTRYKGRWTVQRSSRDAAFRVGSDDIERYHMRQIKYYLYNNGINPEAVGFYSLGMKKGLIIPSSAVLDMVPSKPGDTHAPLIISHLMSVFPQVEVKIVSPQEGEAIYNNIADRRTFGTDFKTVRSFYHKGTAYLVSGRYTNEVAIEEILHPLVDALVEDNPELFNELLAEARKTFPALAQQIENAYSNKKNFDAKDRALELVTQSLSRYVNRQFEEEGGNIKSFAEKFDKFVKWFAEVIRSIVKAFDGGASVSVANMSGMTLSEVADMILTKDLTIDFQIKDNTPRLSIDPKVRADIENMMSKRNITPQQEAALNDVVLNDPMQVELDEETHTYYSATTGQTFVSTTTLINGKMSAADQQKNQMNLIFGNEFDTIMEDLLLGKEWDQIKSKIKNVDLAIAEKAYNSMHEVIADAFNAGSILVPQVIIADEASGVAGTIDILVIHQDGSMDIIDLKTSKTSLQKYDDAYPVDAEDSAFVGEMLSKRNKHGIQVQTYKRILENKGFQIGNTKTLHYLLNVEGTGDSQVVKGFEEENFVEHLDSSNKDRVNKIVPANDAAQNQYQDTKQKNEEQKQTSEDPRFAKENFTEPDNEVLLKFLTKFLDKLNTRQQTIRRLTDESRGMKPKAETLDKIHTLIQLLESDMKRAEFELALGRVLRYSLEDIQAFTSYLSKPENFSKQEFPTVIKAYRDFLATYELFSRHKITDKISPRHADKIREVKDSLEDARVALEKAHLDYVKFLVKSELQYNSSGEIFTDKELDELIGYVDEDGNIIKGEAQDMDRFEFNLGYLASSKDELLNLVNRLVKRKKIQLEEESVAFQVRLSEAGNKLVEASRAAGISDDEIYKFMLVTDESGQFVGRYVTKTSRAYWEKYYELKNAASDEFGKPLEYIEVTDPATQQDAIAHNKKVYEVKSALSAFRNAEKRIGGGARPVDGDHHKYTDEFKADRDHHEYWTGSEWKKLAGVSDEAYAKYIGKYFSEPKRFLRPIKKNGVFTGVVSWSSPTRFVKTEFREPVDVSVDGVSYVDAKYSSIMNPTDDLGRARKEFYEFFRNEFENGILSKLPRDVYYSMLGKAPRVEKALLTKLKTLDGGARLTAVGKMLGKAIDVRGKTFARTAFEKEDGTLTDSPPIFFTADVRNEKRIEKLEEQLKELIDSKGSMPIKEYLNKKEKLRNQIKIEKNKVAVSEISTDLAASLMLFQQQAMEYRKVIEVEDAILAIKKVADERAYQPAGSLGSKIITALGRQKNYATVGNSYVAKRLDHYMKTVLYQNGEFSSSTAEEFVKKVQALTSLTYVGFNWFGNLNNYIMGRIYNGIETAGGQFYGRQEILKAGRAFYTEAIPGFLVGVAEKSGSTDRYKTFKGHSKYEWLVREFAVIRGMQSIEGRVDNPMWNWAYMLQEGGEYEIQSKAGVARLMTIMLKNSITGEELSVYDAYEFDSNTGQAKLKDGFELPLDEKAKIIEGIHRMNEYIQGNYAREDQMVIQANFVGNLVAQFHKWVYPAFQARFKNRYYDRNIGWIEGRYRTLFSFVQAMHASRGNIFEKMQDAKDSMAPDQIANMLKVLAEFGFFVASFGLYHAFALLRDGADDDDKYLRRFLGVLQYQMSKQQRELVTFVSPVEYARVMKNPIASSRALGELASAAELTISAPFLGDKDLYYQRGDRKGQSKIYKEWSDVLPILYTINRWQAYDTVEDFYVK